MNTDQLRAMVGAAHAILFDFDGPLCSVFAGLPARAVAATLLAVLHDRIPTVDLEAFDADDPLDVLRYSEQFGRVVVTEIEDALVGAERRAVQSATPTPGGTRAVQSCVTTGRQVAVVSNNSADAVQDYLVSHGLDELVHAVVGRPYAEPHRMKPNSEPVRQAAHMLSVHPADTLLIGDSLSDIEAARGAGVACVGLANKVAKWDRLAEADIVIGDMDMLAEALDAAPAYPSPQAK